MLSPSTQGWAREKQWAALERLVQGKALSLTGEQTLTWELLPLLESARRRW